jgi:MFS transporter, DHA1 family, inner membrane transport protein
MSRPTRQRMVAAALAGAAFALVGGICGYFGTDSGANLVVAAAGSLGVALGPRGCGGRRGTVHATAITVSAALAAPARRGHALTVVPGGLMVATVLGVPAGALVGQQLGWRAALVAVNLLAAAALLGVLAVVPAVPAEPAVGLVDRLAVLRRRRVLAALVVTVLGIGGSYAVYPYASSVLQQGVGLPAATVSLLLLLYGLGAISGSLLGGFGVDRFGARRILGAAFIVQVLALPAAGTAVVAWGAGTWMQTAPQQYRLLALAPDADRVVISLNASAIYVGIGLGGLLGGLVLSGLPAGTLPLVGAAVTTAALLVLLRSRPGAPVSGSQVQPRRGCCGRAPPAGALAAKGWTMEGLAIPLGEAL